MRRALIRALRQESHKCGGRGDRTAVAKVGQEQREKERGEGRVQADRLRIAERVAADCAEPAKVVSDMTTAAVTPVPAAAASTPNDAPKRNEPTAIGATARTPSRRPCRRSATRPSLPLRPAEAARILSPSRRPEEVRPDDESQCLLRPQSREALRLVGDTSRRLSLPRGTRTSVRALHRSVNAEGASLELRT